MEKPTVIHSTFVIERSYPKAPQHVFSAFADPAKKRRWFAEGDNHQVEEFTMDFRVGGTEFLHYRMGPDTPYPGVALINNGRYQDIVDSKRVVIASAMTLGEKRISASLATVELLPSVGGTDLIFTYQGAFFEGSGGPEFREAGWRHLFDKMEKVLALGAEATLAGHNHA
jgi:uncharacterized protein YndB with AHSA1/START domain